MKVLFLGAGDSPIARFLQEQGEQVTVYSERLDTEWVCSERFDFLVSYGYRHILKQDILALFPQRAINLHISLLPWNRGADPNFWSFFEDTPKGVTIHYLDEGVDTGAILFQQQLQFAPNETLATSYAQLQSAIEELFRNTWKDLRSGNALGVAQTGPGSLHRKADKRAWDHLLTEGWDTPVAKLSPKGADV